MAGRLTSLNLKIHRFEKEKSSSEARPIIFRFDSLIFRGCILVVCFRYLRRNNIKWHAHTHKSRSLSSESSRVCRQTGPFLASEPPQSTMSTVYICISYGFGTSFFPMRVSSPWAKVQKRDAALWAMSPKTQVLTSIWQMHSTRVYTILHCGHVIPLPSCIIFRFRYSTVDGYISFLLIENCWNLDRIQENPPF